MGKSILADEIDPDFGLDFPYDWADKVKALSDAELTRLVEFKAWLDLSNNIQAPEMQAKRESLGELWSLARKFAAEKNAAIDPIEFGWRLPMWREVLENWRQYQTHAILGGNRGAKSVFAARLCVKLLQMIPEARIYAFQVNEIKSVTEQQAYVWEALPLCYKKLGRSKRGSAHNIEFSQKNGFTGNKFILPPAPGYVRGSEMIFSTYQQYRNDPQIVEGMKGHCFWLDEEAPVKMFERLLTRIIDYRGRIVLTFTTIQGWSPLVQDLLGKTKTLRKRFAPLLKKEVEVAQESRSRKNTRIYYFWTQDNPFLPDNPTEFLEGRSEAEIKAVAYGIPTKSANSPFPNFDDTVHVLPADKMPWLGHENDDNPPEFTRYCVADPSGSKPWLIIWFAVDALDRIYAYRESPEGIWAEPGDGPEGKAGPAQKPNGYGIKDYVEAIAHDESTIEGEEIFERVIDPRMGAALTPGKEEATSIISGLEDQGMTFIPAPGLEINHGLQLIKDKLAYDASKPISSLNSPKLFISEACPNLIYAMKNYTAQGGKDEATKDPIDCLRYLLENGCDFIAKADREVKSKTFSY